MQITVEPRENFTILHLRGEFDTFYCPHLQKEMGHPFNGSLRVGKEDQR